MLRWRRQIFRRRGVAALKIAIFVRRRESCSVAARKSWVEVCSGAWRTKERSRQRRLLHERRYNRQWRRQRRPGRGARCTVILQPFAVESRGFHQNAQKLTGNVKSGQILNIVFRYLFSVWQLMKFQLRNFFYNFHEFFLLISKPFFSLEIFSEKTTCIKVAGKL